jgi:hypothetical protein
VVLKAQHLFNQIHRECVEGKHAAYD